MICSSVHFRRNLRGRVGPRVPADVQVQEASALRPRPHVVHLLQDPLHLRAQVLKQFLNVSIY